MDNLGGSYRFWGFGRRIQGKVSPLGVSAKTQSWLRLRLMGIAFGGVLSLLGLFVRALHLTAFLLFVLNTRVLTIAHMERMTCLDSFRTVGLSVAPCPKSGY